MKKYLLILLVILASQSVKSQILISLLLGDVLNSEKIEFGLDGGVNFGNVSNLEPGKLLPMFNLGFYFDITLKDQWMLHTGVIVKSSQGKNKLEPYPLENENLNNIFSTGYVTRKVNQFSVPILIKYRFANYFHVEAGPMLALRTKGYDEFKNTLVDTDDASFRVDIKDHYKRIDAGIMCGAGFKLSKAPKTTQYGIRYYHGFVDPLKENTGKAQYFSSIYLYASIPIGVGKADKPEE
jgi:hypothetical protein